VIARAWARWLSLWRGEEDVRLLALVRILVGTVLAADLLWTGHLGLVDALWGTDGIVDILGRDPQPELWRFLGAGTLAGRLAYGLSLAGALGLAVGFCTRSSAVLLLLAYAQLAQANGAADRGIDTLVRNATLVLACSAAHRAWSLDAAWARWRGKALPTVGPAWPRRLLALQLVVVYFAAGIQKVALSWTPLGGFSALYLVLQDPSIASWRFDWLARVHPITQLATAATMAFEWGSCLVPLAWHAQRTRTRAGWWRAQSNRYRWVRGWMLIGVLLHLGIAATMSLGIFPWAMLALYPALLHPDEVFGARPHKTLPLAELPA
jgi:hypothetical protein